MPIDSIDSLIAVLRSGRLLLPSQLEELSRLQTRFSEPRLLAQDMIQRGWLTDYQIQQVFSDGVAGLVLGPYLLLERLGEGGMGQVFKARHLRLERIVALKVIRPDRLTNPDTVERFQREARAAARLHHPNIVTLYDADEINGTHFLAMEYVEGVDLAALVQQRGPLPVAEACDFIRQAALGLQHAHEQGLVHRDIKPHNLLRTSKSGVIKILDMGLARLQPLTEDSPDAGKALTREGHLVGSPDYIAPEQAVNSHAVDIRADLYSLGCSLYYLLTGSPPFPNGSLTAKLLNHQLHQPRPVEQMRPDVSADVVALVHRLMAKQPQERYQSPAELVETLSAIHPPASLSLTLPGSQAIKLPEPGAATVTSGQTPPVEPRIAVPSRIASATPVARAGGPTQSWADLTLASRRKKVWLAVLACVAALLMLLIVWLVRRHPDEPTRESDRDAAAWSLDQLSPARYTAHNEGEDWPPRGLVLMLGSQLGRHWGAVRSVAYRPDGRLIASAGDDGRICLWQADSLEDYRILRGHVGMVRCVLFTKDGKHLLSGGEDKTVRLWDVEEGKERFKGVGHTDPVSCVALSADGSQALSGGNGPTDHSIRLWDLRRPGKPVNTFTGHTGRILCLRFAAGKDGFVSTALDNTVRTWDLSKTQPRTILTREFDQKNACAELSENAEMLLCTGERTHVVDLRTGKEFPEVTKASSGAFSTDNRLICLGNFAAEEAWVHESKTGLLVRHFTPEIPGGMHSCVFSPDNRHVLSASDGGLILLWDYANDKQILPRPGHSFGCICVALSRDGRHVLSGGGDDAVRLWDLTTDPPGQQVWVFKEHQESINAVAFSPDGQLAVSASIDQTIRLIDVPSGKEVQRFEGPKGEIEDVVFLSDGKHIISAHADHFVRMWDVKTGQEVGRFFGHEGVVHSVAVSPDGKQLLSGSDDGTMRLWDLETRQELRRYRGATGNLRSVAFAPDGRHALSGSEDGSVRLWDLDRDTSQNPLSYVGQSNQVEIAYAPDGTKLAASSSDGTVLVWDAFTRKKLRRWKMPGAVIRIIFSADGRHLLTSNGNGTVYVLRIDPSAEAK